MDLTGRVVSREDLVDSDASSQTSNSEHEIDDLLRKTIGARLVSQYEITAPKVLEPVEESIGAETGPGEDELEFRLFSSGPSNIAKIRVESPDDSNQPPGLINPERPQSYYFRLALSEAEKEQIRTATLSGEDVINLSRVPWPGCAFPWRVMTISQSGKALSRSLNHTQAAKVDAKGKKARPSKKMRIARRKSLSAKTERLEQEKHAKNEKEEALREKKTRKNRQRKVKRRVKEKAKKEVASAVMPEELTDSRQES